MLKSTGVERAQHFAKIVFLSCDNNRGEQKLLINFYCSSGLYHAYGAMGSCGCTGS